MFECVVERASVKLAATAKQPITTKPISPMLATDHSNARLWSLSLCITTVVLLSVKSV